MVIYEINIMVDDAIFDEFYPWLISHAEEMFQFRGFNKAEIAKEKKSAKDTENTTKLTIRYNVETENDLNDYLKNYAIKRRENAIKKFGDRFKAERRVFIESVEVSAECDELEHR